MTLKRFVEHHAFVMLCGFATGGVLFWIVENEPPVGSAWLCLIWLVVWFVCWVKLRLRERKANSTGWKA